MRLKINILVIDDDFEDDDKARGILSLIKKIENHIEEKGFEPVILKRKSIEEVMPDNISGISLNSPNRIDLCLSDNNLGNLNIEKSEKTLENAGIDFYLSQVKHKLICDFILYTRTSVDEIVNKLSADLLEKKDPNLFSRFTFVSRDARNDNWHSKVIDVLGFMLSKREELNNLRGLFAQETAIMHDMLKKLNNNDNLDFWHSIKKAKEKENSVISDELYDRLNLIRKKRNAIIHNDELFCNFENQWYIEYKYNDDETRKIFESEFSELRKELKKLKKDLEDALTTKI